MNQRQVHQLANQILGDIDRDYSREDWPQVLANIKVNAENNWLNQSPLYREAVQYLIDGLTN